MDFWGQHKFVYGNGDNLEPEAVIVGIKVI